MGASLGRLSSADHRITEEPVSVAGRLGVVSQPGCVGVIGRFEQRRSRVMEVGTAVGIQRVSPRPAGRVHAGSRHRWGLGPASRRRRHSVSAISSRSVNALSNSVSTSPGTIDAASRASPRPLRQAPGTSEDGITDSCRERPARRGQNLGDVKGVAPCQLGESIRVHSVLGSQERRRPPVKAEAPRCGRRARRWRDHRGPIAVGCPEGPRHRGSSPPRRSGFYRRACPRSGLRRALPGRPNGRPR